MGLDLSHGAWRGAYGAFKRFREALALAAGYEVDDGSIYIDWGHTTHRNFFGEWDAIPCSTLGPDPLLILIIHSDCDGSIEPEHCALLVDRLTELLPALEGQDGLGHLGNLQEATQRFINGCREAATAGEPLEFY
jgi:hypothetical protein